MALSLPGGWSNGSDFSIYVIVIDTRDPFERRKRIQARPWSYIKDLKDLLQPIFQVPSTRQRLFFNGTELKNSRTVQDCGIFKDGTILHFSIARPSDMRRGQFNTAIHIYGDLPLSKSILRLINKVQHGFDLGYVPELAMDGSGGTYFLRDATKRLVACFKPQDEEPYAPYNPREFVGTMGQSSLRKGIWSGEACQREAAAYLLDKNHFSSVPATALVESLHPVYNYDGKDPFFKIGSLQEFVQHDDVASDISPHRFDTDQVHRIAILDIRLVNADRNDANILVRKRNSKEKPSSPSFLLIPIDHGYTLPDSLEIAWCDWCWYSWPQIKKPLSPDDIEYIKQLDPENDAQFLRNKMSFREDCIRNMIIATWLLKIGVKEGLSLYDIATLMCRMDIDRPSPLEMMYTQAMQEIGIVMEVDGMIVKSGELVKKRPSLYIDINAYDSNEPDDEIYDSPIRSPIGFWDSSSGPFNSNSFQKDWDSVCLSCSPNFSHFGQEIETPKKKFHPRLDSVQSFDEKRFFSLMKSQITQQIEKYKVQQKII